MIEQQEHIKGQICTKVLNYAPFIDRGLSEDVICMGAAGKHTPQAKCFRERRKVVGARTLGAIHIEREQENRRLLLSFVKSIQERDLVTYEHSRRVATYAYRLARYLGWSRREASNLALAALVHDLGKTWIGNNILNKSAALSDEERRTIERHPVIGARILIGCDVDRFYVETVLHHHEAWDGRGYPAGLQGEEIPMGARILAVADVYDALTTERPYKAPLSKDAARERLLLGAAAKFDPTIVQAFLNLLELHPDFALGNLPARLMRRTPHLAGI